MSHFQRPEGEFIAIGQVWGQNAPNVIQQLELFCLEDSLQGQVQQTLAKLVELPFKNREVGLDRRWVGEDGRQPDVEATQLVESRVIERVPRLIERRRVIVLVDDQRDAVLHAVRRE